MFWRLLATENIVQKMRASGSQNKTKQIDRFSPLLPFAPTKSCSTSLTPCFQQRSKNLCNLILPHCFLVSREQEALTSRYLCPGLGWTDGLGLFTAASTRHNSPTQTLRGLLCARLCSLYTRAGENVT